MRWVPATLLARLASTIESGEALRLTGSSGKRSQSIGPGSMPANGYPGLLQPALRPDTADAPAPAVLLHSQ